MTDGGKEKVKKEKKKKGMGEAAETVRAWGNWKGGYKPIVPAGREQSSDIIEL